MQIDVHAKEKIVCVWLNHADQESPGTKEKLKALYAEYERKKYLVSVFFSGKGELSELTLGLLQYNKKKLEQDRMVHEKAVI